MREAKAVLRGGCRENGSLEIYSLSDLELPKYDVTIEELNP